MTAPRWTLVLVAGAAVALLIGAAGPANSAAPPGRQRIVSLLPSVTETLFALRAGDEVVGVSQYCDYPPEVTKLPRVGSYLTPNVEAIVALRPTLVIAGSLSSGRRQMRALNALGIDTLLTGDGSLQDIEQSIVNIGVRIGRRREAQQLLDDIRARIAAVTHRLNGAPTVPVLMVVGHEPMVAVGAENYLGELIVLARGENIAAQSAQAWPRLSMEYIIAMRPQVILDGQMGSEAAAPAGFWSAYATIPAVREHRVFGYPIDPILHPGPRVWQSLEIIAARLHPRFMDSDGRHWQ
ncbi:MAG: ABC transporter substrate-binding protein [Candidatus Binataceae bacterium]